MEWYQPLEMAIESGMRGKDTQFFVWPILFVLR